MQTSILGVHAGNNKDKNYTTAFHENMFLDFISPNLNARIPIPATIAILVDPY